MRDLKRRRSDIRRAWSIKSKKQRRQTHINNLILFLLKPAMLLTGVVRTALFSRGTDREEGSSVATSFVATLLLLHDSA